MISEISNFQFGILSKNISHQVFICQKVCSTNYFLEISTEFST
jgi:hypothetical protein